MTIKKSLEKKIKATNLSANDDYEIVYSDDPCFNKTKPRLICEPVDPAKAQLKMRLEKNQRGGKLVTIIDNLPPNQDYFLDLTKKLKNHCGSGGTFKDKHIEIQGDHRVKISAFLTKLGFKIR